MKPGLVAECFQSRIFYAMRQNKEENKNTCIKNKNELVPSVDIHAVN